MICVAWIRNLPPSNYGRQPIVRNLRLPSGGRLGEAPLALAIARTEPGPAFVDAWPAAGNGEDPGFTFIYLPEQPEMRDQRIDYCFLSPALADKVRACRVGAAAKGSDRQPVWTELAA